MEVRYYISDSGHNPVKEWQDGFSDFNTKARIEARITRLKGGNLSGSKSVGEGVHELVIDFGPGYRIYFAPHGSEIIMLLCAGSKKRQQSDIMLSKEYWANYKSRLSKLKDTTK